jgi:hypothetical protein
MAVQINENTEWGPGEKGWRQAAVSRQQAWLAFAVPNLGPHTAFLAADLSSAFSGFLRSHTVLQINSGSPGSLAPP